MFFKMLKKDLLVKKGLNIIIFFFICASAVLLVASVLHIYTSTLGIKNAAECTIMSYGSAIVSPDINYRQKVTSDICSKLDNNQNVTDYSLDSVIKVNGNSIDFNGYDEEKDQYLKSIGLYMSKLPQKFNLLYTNENKPFYVENGCIAISVNLKNAVNAKKGDKVRLTTQMGYTYEFTISEFYKTCRNSYINLLVLSDADYELISDQSPVKDDLLDIKTEKSTQIADVLVSLPKDIDHASLSQCINDTGFSAGSDISIAITSFMMIICFFMIFIIFLSIRFTLISAIREKKKEIGMMRALGINSLGFRILFAAKYFTFAVAGGIIGVAAGIPLAGKLSGEFAPNAIINDKCRLFVISVISVAVFICIIILYILMVLRRINKISVIDVIHGDNKGERFRKSQKVYLHKQKKMPVSFYLALSDLINGFKRYILLVLVYSTGLMVILFGVHLKNTITSQDFLKYYLYMNTDFSVNNSDESWSRYIKQYGSPWAALDQFNSELKNADIPAEIQYDYWTLGNLIPSSDSEKSCVCFFGNYDSRKIKYRKGGTAPLLENEIAISSHSARMYDLSVGDRVSIRVSEYMDDMISTEEVTREYVITGIFDYMEFSDTGIIFGNEYDKAIKTGIYNMEYTIDAPDNLKSEYIIKMKDIFGDNMILSGDEWISSGFSYLLPVINLIETTVFIMALAVMIMITVIHYSVLSNEDAAFIAMLKCMGLGNPFIRKWQLIRTAILLVISAVIGNVLMYTLGNFIASKLFLQYGLEGFRFIIDPLKAYIIVPFIVFAVVMIVMRIVLKNIKKVNIRDISSD